MKRRFTAVAFSLVCVLATPAYARHHKTHGHHVSRHITATTHVVKTRRIRRAAQVECNHLGCTPDTPSFTRSMSARANPAAGLSAEALTANASARYAGGDPRPRSWCGWWMRHYLGVADRSFNLARNWARYGSPAGGPSVGTIVVWRSHVGIITGRSGDGWIIKSGNDDHAVRERERPLRGVIAYRTQG